MPVLPGLSRLRLPARLGYGLGHVLNDLTAAVWFSYLLLYFHNVVHFSNSLAGGVLLLGQLVDALTTPLIGYESDGQQGIWKFGKRKSWHLLGTMCVLVGFPPLFLPIPGSSPTEDWAEFLYYVPFVVIFQFGWASTQVAHLALLPELTKRDDERVELNAIKNGATLMASVVVYASSWLILGFDSIDNSGNLGRKDWPFFRTLVVIVCATGMTMCVLFYLGVAENARLTISHRLVERADQHRKMSRSAWLKEPQFYQVTVLYTCSRLMSTLSQIYLPLFVTSSLKLDKEYIASVPMAVYISGFCTSLLMKTLNSLTGTKMLIFFANILVGCACCWMGFISNLQAWQIILVAILLGMGTSAGYISTLTISAEMIGENTENGAFVYGVMSMVDKIASGTIVFFLQLFHPCREIVCCEACVWYYRNIMVYGPATVAGCCLITAIIIAPSTIGKLKFMTQENGFEYERDYGSMTPKRGLLDDDKESETAQEDMINTMFPHEHNLYNDNRV